MILLIYVTHNNEFNSLKKFVLDMLKSGAIAQLGGGGGSAWVDSRKPSKSTGRSPV
jgi:hypothetical protein